MEWALIVAIAGLSVAAAVALGVASARGRTLRTIAGLTAGDEETQDVATRVRRLRDRAAAGQLELDRQVGDAFSFAELIGVGILRLDDSLRIETANADAHVLLGRAPGSIIGRSAMEAFVDTRFEGLLVAARDSGSAVAEFRVRGGDGPVLMIRARRSPLRGVWAVIEDVSELRRLQQMRAEFIDNLSHELRTPLTTISLLAETLARDAETTGTSLRPKMRDRINKIEVETGHLVQMVNELLDLARIESGGRLSLVDNVDLGKVVGDSVERLRLFAERQGLRLRVEVEPDIPAVRGDEARLGQVVVNLVHNALKFGGEAGDVTIAVRVEGGEVITSVRDEGIGIPKKDQARIFERFYKVDRARVRGGGTGLGLAIARHVIEQHGGRIWVDSEEGVGSTFSFGLPIPGAAEPSN